MTDLINDDESSKALPDNQAKIQTVVDNITRAYFDEISYIHKGINNQSTDTFYLSETRHAHMAIALITQDDALSQALLFWATKSDNDTNEISFYNLREKTKTFNSMNSIVL